MDSTSVAPPQHRSRRLAITEAFLQPCLGGRFQPIGDDFEGSSIQVLEGVEHVPGLREALARRASQPGS